MINGHRVALAIALVAQVVWAQDMKQPAGRSPGREPAESRAGATTKTEDSKMGHMVIVAYRPKPGKDAALLELVRNHMPVLKGQGLVTDRPAYAMRAKDGTIVEVFEWKSGKAVDEAHTNPAVQAMWQKFGEACDYIPVGELDEAKGLFSAFTPIDLSK